MLAERIALAVALAPLLLLASVAGWLALNATFVAKSPLLLKALFLTAKASLCALWGIAVMAQVLRMRVTVDQHGVEIRNMWRTRSLRWDEIDEFVGSTRAHWLPSTRAPRAALYARLRSGEMVPIEAVWVPSLEEIPGRRRPWQREMDALNSDLRAARDGGTRV